MVDDGRTDGRRTDGRMTDHGHPISSPCEPDGSGELKKLAKRFQSKWSFISLPGKFTWLACGSGELKYEPPHEKTSNLPMRKQRRRSASQ